MSRSPSLTPPPPSELLNPQGVSDPLPRLPNATHVNGLSVSHGEEPSLADNNEDDGDVTMRVAVSDQDHAEDERVELAKDVEELAEAGDGVEPVNGEGGDYRDSDIGAEDDVEDDAGPDANVDAAPEASGELSLHLTC